MSGQKEKARRPDEVASQNSHRRHERRAKAPKAPCNVMPCTSRCTSTSTSDMRKAARLSWRPLKGRLRLAGVLRASSAAERGGIGAVCRAYEEQLLGTTCTCHWRKQLHPLKADAHPCLQRLLPFAAVGVGDWLRAFSLRGWSRLDVFADRCGIAKGKVCGQDCMYIGKRSRIGSSELLCFVCFELPLCDYKPITASRSDAFVGKNSDSPVNQIKSKLPVCIHRAIKWPFSNHIT